MSESERGQIAVVTLGFFIILGLLAIMVVNVSAAFLEHQRLDGLADGAALAAVDALSEADFYRSSSVEQPPLDVDEARRRVNRYLGGEQLTSVHVEVSGNSVTVRLARMIDMAIASPGMPRRSMIVSRARADLRMAAR